MEYHLDATHTFYERLSTLSFGRSLSVLQKPINSQPVVFVGQDEAIFNSFYFELSCGLAPLVKGHCFQKLKGAVTRDHSASGAVEIEHGLTFFSVFYYGRRPNPESILYFRVNNGFYNACCSITHQIPKTTMEARSVVLHVCIGLISCAEPSSFWFLFTSICNLTMTFHGEVQETLLFLVLLHQIITKHRSVFWRTSSAVCPAESNALLSLAHFWKRNLHKVLIPV